MEIDYRMEGLTNFVKTELVPYLAEQGFIKPDFETVGNILSEVYKGENEKFEELTKRMRDTRLEAEAFLKKIQK